MYGPTNGQWNFLLALAAIGVVAVVLTIVVGIPAAIWWVFHHVSFY
jgi:ABC-type proline/glycine betaine transport system permease subunit